MRLATIRTRILVYRVKRNASHKLRQAYHTDYFTNRSLQFGNSKGYWMLLSVVMAVLIAAQIFHHF